MLYATVEGSRTTADPKFRNSQATCPCCQAPVVAKCGEIKIWHWAHKIGAECDFWHQGETEWHRSWKSLFPKDCVEVPLGPHRADVKIDGLVIEFQNSAISTVEIKDREQFYGEMFWVFNASDWDITEHTTKLGKPTWKWRHPHRSLTAVNAPLFIDFGGDFCFVHEIDWELSLLSVMEISKTEFVSNPREALEAARIALAEKAEKERLQEIEHERQRREEQLRLEAQREKARQEAMLAQQKAEAERVDRARQAAERWEAERRESERRQAELDKENAEAYQKNRELRDAEEPE